MNLVDCEVLEIFSQDKYEDTVLNICIPLNRGFIVKFKYICYGVETIIETWVENELKVGDIIQM